MRFRERFQYAPPWKTLRPWLPRIWFGSDQWFNQSVVFDGPWGSVTIFYTRFVDRNGWYLSGTVGHTAMYYSPDVDDPACAYWPLRDAVVALRNLPPGTVRYPAPEGECLLDWLPSPVTEEFLHMVGAEFVEDWDVYPFPATGSEDEI